MGQRPEISILQLNSDCIHHLCSFLAPLDRMSLGIADDIFVEPIRHFIQLETVVMDDLMTHFSVHDVSELLKRFGAFIKRINCHPKGNETDSSYANKNIKKYFLLVAKHCTNIEDIVICYPWKPDFLTYHRIFESAKCITKVKVACSRRIETRSSMPSELDSSLSELFRRLSLKSLDVSYQRDLVGSCLPRLKQLVELNLEYCDLLEPKYLIRLMHVAQLKTLNVINCHRLTDVTFEVLYSTQTNLESIAISNNYCCRNLEIVGRLEGLRHIQFEDYSQEQLQLGELLDQLILHHAADLESLEINNDYTYGNRGASVLRSITYMVNVKKLTLPDVTATNDDFLKQIIQKCTKLEELTLNVYENGSWIKDETFLQIVAGKYMRSIRIGSEFRFKTNLLKRIYEILQTKNKPLNIYLDERSVDTSILSTPEYKANEKIFKIHINEVNIDDMLTSSYLF